MSEGGRESSRSDKDLKKHTCSHRYFCRNVEIKSSKYKTSLCSFFQQNIECPYGNLCTYAHGENDLHNEETNIDQISKLTMQPTGVEDLVSFLTNNGGMGKTATPTDTPSINRPLRAPISKPFKGLARQIGPPSRSSSSFSMPKSDLSYDRYYTNEVPAYDMFEEFPKEPSVTDEGDTNSSFLWDDLFLSGSTEVKKSENGKHFISLNQLHSPCTYSNPFAYFHDPYSSRGVIEMHSKKICL